MPTAVEATTEEDSERGARREVTAHSHLFRLIDCSHPIGASSRHALRGIERVVIGRGDAGAVRTAGERALRLEEKDARISSTHATLNRMPGRWVLEDAGSRNGTLVNGAQAQTTALHDGDLIEVGRTFFLFREAVPTPGDRPLDVTVAPSDSGLATLNPPLESLLVDLERVARSTVSVVIGGETGTGKELIARAVHRLSGRRGPFVAVNCGAIPANLVESELFGARRGAYSDAKEDRPGLVRSAHEGTLFLDEIGDLDLAQQAAFLRVLQEREVVPIGQTRAIPVDLRVVSASHRDLATLREQRQFREDLAARLSGFNVLLPPLRARREDLGLIIATLISRLTQTPASVSFQADAMRLLLAHDWPQNVRELEKRLETAIVLAGERPIRAEQLGDLFRPGPPPRPPAAEDPRRDELARLLQEHAGNLSAVARVLGKDRAQLRRWLKRYKINPATFRA